MGVDVEKKHSVIMHDDSNDPSVLVRQDGAREGEGEGEGEGEEWGPRLQVRRILFCGLQGNTCLHFCFGYNYRDLGEYLITKGADSTLRNRAGVDCRSVTGRSLTVAA